MDFLSPGVFALYATVTTDCTVTQEGTESSKPLDYVGRLNGFFLGDTHDLNRHSTRRTAVE